MRAISTAQSPVRSPSRRLRTRASISGFATGPSFQTTWSPDRRATASLTAPKPASRGAVAHPTAAKPRATTAARSPRGGHPWFPRARDGTGASSRVRFFTKDLHAATDQGRATEQEPTARSESEDAGARKDGNGDGRRGVRGKAEGRERCSGSERHDRQEGRPVRPSTGR